MLVNGDLVHLFLLLITFHFTLKTEFTVFPGSHCPQQCFSEHPVCISLCTYPVSFSTLEVELDVEFWVIDHLCLRFIAFVLLFSVAFVIIYIHTNKLPTGLRVCVLRFINIFKSAV